MIWTKEFWKGAGERALKTFLQVFVPTAMAALGATSTGTLDAWTAPWLVAAQTATGLALGATVISLLMSLGNAEFVAGTKVATVEPFTDHEREWLTAAAAAGNPVVLDPTPFDYDGNPVVAGRVASDDEVAREI